MSLKFFMKSYDYDGACFCLDATRHALPGSPNNLRMTQTFVQNLTYYQMCEQLHPSYPTQLNIFGFEKFVTGSCIESDPISAPSRVRTVR